MDCISRIRSWHLILLILLLGITLAHGQVRLHDPTWEAPGGYVQMPSGISPGHAGGKTWVYSTFDSTAFDSLFYVMGDYDYDPGPPETWTFNPEGPAMGTSLNGMTRLYFDAVASDLENGKIAWTNQIDIYDASASVNRPYRARFTLRVYDSSAAPIALIAAHSLAGMDPRVGGAHQIFGVFTANWQFELSSMGSIGWQAAVEFYDALSTDPLDALQTSVTRAFYFKPVPGDFDADGDIDGVDLSDLIADASLLDLALFAKNFGKAN